MNIEFAENLITKKKNKDEKKREYMKNYRKEKNKINKINLNLNNTNENIYNNFEIKNNIVSLWEKRGYKNIKKETVNDYSIKIKRIHKEITKKDININILLNILNNDYNENDISYIIKELYYLENNILINYLFDKYNNKTTIKTYLIPFSVICSYIEYYKKKNIYNEIAKYIIKIGKEYEYERDNNSIKKTEINKIINNYNEDILLNNIEKLTNIEDKIIYGLYTLIPPRRLEYSNMIILLENNELELSEDHNYLICDLNYNPKYFIFKNYKTSNVFGEQKILIPNTLSNLIGEYLLKKNKKDEEKFLDKTSNTLGKNITKIFSSIYNEKITLRWLRISYATYIRKKNLTNNELKEISEKMAHSLHTNSRYNKIKMDENIEI
jgi:hypothetical protein